MSLVEWSNKLNSFLHMGAASNYLKLNIYMHIHPQGMCYSKQ